DLVEQAWVLLQLRRDLEHDVVGIELREVLLDLALADRVVDRRIDHRRRDAVAGGLVTVDGEVERGGGARRRSRIRGAQSLSSEMSASVSVYWYCVRAMRPPTLMTCAACR